MDRIADGSGEARRLGCGLFSAKSQVVEGSFGAFPESVQDNDLRMVIPQVIDIFLNLRIRGQRVYPPNLTGFKLAHELLKWQGARTNLYLGRIPGPKGCFEICFRRISPTAGGGVQITW